MKLQQFPIQTKAQLLTEVRRLRDLAKQNQVRLESTRVRTKPMDCESCIRHWIGMIAPLVNDESEPQSYNPLFAGSPYYNSMYISPHAWWLENVHLLGGSNHELIEVIIEVIYGLTPMERLKRLITKYSFQPWLLNQPLLKPKRYETSTA